MGKLRLLVKFLLLSFLFISNPAFSQEGMTDTQKIIFRQTLAVGGSITKEMHNRFWDDAPKDTSGQYLPIFLFLLESTKFAQAYQAALWQSALISYQQGQFIRTETLDLREREFSEFFLEPAPFAKGSNDYEIFVRSYKSQVTISLENSRRLLDAAANHKDLVGANGEVAKIDGALITTVLAGLTSSFDRLKLLIDPVWRGG